MYLMSFVFVEGVGERGEGGGDGDGSRVAMPSKSIRLFSMSMLI